MSHISTATGQLLLDLFDDQAHALAKPFEQWVATSKAFTTFAQTYQSKIRKKIRMSRDIEESYNLYCELRTAYLLLQEPKFAVAYEPHGLRAGRSADFAVTFRTNSVFHVEVTRLRASQQEQQFDPHDSAQVESIRRYESRRLMDVVCDKFEQLSPETPNLLWVWSDSRVMQELDIGELLLGLKRRVEQRDPDLFTRHGFGKPADFLRFYQRVSAILVQSPHLQATTDATRGWQNKDARHPLPTKVANTLHALIATDTSQTFTVNRPS